MNSQVGEGHDTSMLEQTDERTPLLPEERGDIKKKKTPLPWFQFSIMLFLQLAEPLTSHVIYPFAPQLIRDIGITNGKESQVGYYVGVIQSLFFLTEAVTVLHWSRISDSVGRKPVILTGLFGLSISMYCFGLSRTFWGLVVSRSLNGALNGNVGVLKSMTAELTDITNIAQAYAYMPIAWSTGATIGPIIGGSLSRPAERFPHLFGNNEFLKTYPYFLPCAIAATFSALAWVVTFLFLKETVPQPTPVSQFLGISKKKGYEARDPESPRPSITSLSSAAKPSLIEDNPIAEIKKQYSLRSVITPQVIVAAGNYASLSFVEIAYRAIQPVFFATPIELGGLGLPPATIGKLLSIVGILNGILQVFFFARITDYWGPKKVFTAGIASTIPVFLTFPLMNYIARTEGYSTLLWTVVGFQIVVSLVISFSFGTIFIFITAAAPSRGMLGATNGLSQVGVSVMRAIGPAAANSLFSMTIEHGYMGGNLVYYVLLLTVCGSLVFASMLPRQIWVN